MLSHIQLCETPWTVAHKAPLSIEFLRQEYWNGLPLPSAGDLPTPGTEPMFLMFATLAGNYLVPSGKGFKSENVSHSVTRSTPWTVAHQAPLAMEFSRKDYWSGLPFPFPGNLPDPGI